MKHITFKDRATVSLKGLLTVLLTVLLSGMALIMIVPAFAVEGTADFTLDGYKKHGPSGPGNFGRHGPHNGCKLYGSWLGYSASTGDAWWMSTVSGQNASAGTVVLEVPGFDITLPVGEPPEPTFPGAIESTDLRGTWKRIDGNTFAYTVLGIVVDENGTTQYISKLTGTETLIDGCNTMFLENTALQIFLPQADPFEDTALIGPIPFPDHYGFRMKVDLP